MIAGRKSSEEFNSWIGSDLLETGYTVVPGRHHSRRLSQRILFIPNEYQDLPKISFVSSRLPKNPTGLDEWFHFFREGVSQESQKGNVVITIAKSTCDRFLRAALSEHSFVLCSIAAHENSKCSKWLGQLKNLSGNNSIVLSPCLSGKDAPDKLDRDDVLNALSDRIRVLKIKRNSNTEHRIKNQLRSAFSHSEKHIKPMVLFAEDEKLIPSNLSNELKKLGAKPWQLANRVKPTTSVTGLTRNANSDQIQSLSRMNESLDYLFHCTRAPDGPWPDQSEDQYLQELISCEKLVERTALSSLARIIRQQRIVSNSRFNRTAETVVSFTAADMEKIKSMRSFRSHLARWDFEPFGFGIKRQKLVELFSAQQVKYGNEFDFQNCDDDQQKFFQQAKTTTKSGKTIDWTVEEEWRVPGDVDLTRLDKDDCLVFVPSRIDAIEIAKNSCYRIVVLNE